MSAINSYDVVAVCSFEETKKLISALITNYCKYKDIEIVLKTKLQDLIDQMQCLCDEELGPRDAYDETMRFMLEMIDGSEDNDSYNQEFSIYYLKNGLFVNRFTWNSEYMNEEYRFEDLSNQIGQIPFFVMLNPEETGHDYFEISNFDKDTMDYEDAVKFFCNYYLESDYVWELLEDKNDPYGIVDMLENAINKPAPDANQIIMNSEKMKEIQETDSEEFLRQRRLIADIVLWSGWNPKELQPFIDHINGKEVDKENIEEHYNIAPLNNGIDDIVAQWEDFQE